MLRVAFVEETGRLPLRDGTCEEKVSEVEKEECLPFALAAAVGRSESAGETSRVVEIPSGARMGM